MSNKLKHSWVELNRASQRFDDLMEAKSFEDFEHAWVDIFTYLDKCWNKVERECQHVKNKFLPWQGKYKSLIKKDPLLCYAKAVRDADTHTIQEKVEKAPVSFRFQSTGSTLIEGFTLNLNLDDPSQSSFEAFGSGDPLKVTFLPERIEALSILNSGKVYTPPLYHKGKAIKIHKNPFEIAELAIMFYKDYLIEAEKKFFT